MKIVVLDGYTLNPGDLSWQELGALGELTVYDRTATADILHPVRYAAYADIRRKSWHYQNGYTYANVETGWTGM